MPRIRQNREKDAKKDLAKAFEIGIVNSIFQNRKELFESTGAGGSYSTLNRRLNHPETFTLEELRKLLPVCPVGDAIQKYLGG